MKRQLTNKINWTKKDQRFMRCICCDGITLNKFEGWWIHKKCLAYIKNYIHTWDATYFKIKLELIDWKKAIELYINSHSDEIQKYNEELTEKAFEVFNERHKKPAWVKNNGAN